MTHHPGIYKRASSPYYYAKIRCWDSTRQKWTWKALSTQTTDPQKALATKAEQQALADLAHQSNDSHLTKKRATQMATRILRWHGLESENPDDLACPPWSKYASDWLRRQKSQIASTTVSQYQGHINRFTEWLQTTVSNPLRPDSNLDQIKRRHIHDFQAQLQQSGRAAKTTRNILRTLTMIFTAAIDDEYLQRNPVPDLRNFGPVHTRSDEPFTSQDISRLILHLTHPTTPTMHAAEWHTASLFGLCLGCRLGDATHRTWDEIQHHPQTGAPYITYQPEKTRRYRQPITVPLADPLLSHLRSQTCHLSEQQKHRHRTRSGQPHYITPELASIPVGARNGLSYHFTQIMKRSQITWTSEQPRGPKGKTWNSKGFHSFRHTLTTIMASAEVPEEIRMAIVGHTQRATHQRYTHHDDQRLRNALHRSLSPFTQAQPPTDPGHPQE